MQALIIYELLPEETIIALVPDAPTWVTAASGKFINGGCDEGSDGYSALVRIGDALAGSTMFCESPDDDLATQWHRFIVDRAKPIKTVGDLTVIHCGFII